MFYPLFIDLKRKKVLIIGGGDVGSRRALYMLKAGAVVTVISKEFSKKLSIKNKNLRLIRKEINDKNINKINLNHFLIIISTNNKRINKKITNKVKINKKLKNRILVCRADKPSDGNVIFPSVSRIKNNVFAFTTFGKNPKLSKKIKNLIENARKT
jgi:precorrin-2 dehydrogenase/sirohydrochlorin ferrochelatase|tara:strand:+ start:524 stop:991 length:468 start_codon:yes stop_codon:yes gene_type:complete